MQRVELDEGDDGLHTLKLSFLALNEAMQDGGLEEGEWDEEQQTHGFKENTRDSTGEKSKSRKETESTIRTMGSMCLSPLTIGRTLDFELGGMLRRNQVQRAPRRFDESHDHEYAIKDMLEYVNGGAAQQDVRIPPTTFDQAIDLMVEMNDPDPLQLLTAIALDDVSENISQAMHRMRIALEGASEKSPVLADVLRCRTERLCKFIVRFLGCSAQQRLEVMRSCIPGTKEAAAHLEREMLRRARARLATCIIEVLGKAEAACNAIQIDHMMMSAQLVDTQLEGLDANEILPAITAQDGASLPHTSRKRASTLTSRCDSLDLESIICSVPESLSWQSSPSGDTAGHDADPLALKFLPGGSSDDGDSDISSFRSGSSPQPVRLSGAEELHKPPSKLSKRSSASKFALAKKVRRGLSRILNECPCVVN